MFRIVLGCSCVRVFMLGEEYALGYALKIYSATQQDLISLKTLLP